MKKHSIKKMFSNVLVLLLLTSMILPLGACRDDGKDIYEDAPKLVVAPKKLTFLSSAIVKELEMESTIKAEELSFQIPANAKAWLSVTKTDNNTIQLSVTNAGFITKRATVFTIVGLGMRQVIDIEQLGLAAELDPDKDIQFFASKATATSENIVIDDEGNEVPGADHQPAKYIIDGDRGTFHNSKFGEVKEWPFVYEVTFDTPAEHVDYINLVPRQDAGNKWGAFGKFDLYVSTTERPEFTKLKEGGYDAQERTSATFEITPEKPITSLKAIKIEVHNALNNRVSLAEVEFFKKSGGGKYDPSAIFTDSSCSEIKGGVTQADIEAIPSEFYRVLADAIFNKTYDDTGFRIQTYRAYQEPKIKADENFTESYSIHDNPTGIYVTEPGEKVYIFVGPSQGRHMSLILEKQKFFGDDPSFYSREYPLTEGENVIEADNSGLLYIKYLVDESLELNPETATEKKAVEDLTTRINIFGGVINGYYNNKKHSLEDWKRALSYNVGSNIFDVQGDRIHLSWAKSTFKDRLADPTEVLHYWDLILVLEQEFMGLEKYSSQGGLATGGKPDRKFRNRMFIHVNPGNPAATSGRLHFPHNTGMNYDDLFVDANVLKERIWGPAHEMGHINQMRPSFNWGGMIETTNNIFCLYIQHTLGNPTRLEQENYYQSAKSRIIDAYEADPTNLKLPLSGYAQDDASHFEKIVPFWQLFLYMKVNGYEDFYKDVFEQYRLLGLKVPGFTGTNKNDSDNSLKDHGVLQTEFALQACKASKMDLREFFRKWGFLRKSDMTWKDYQERIFKVTDQRLKEVDDWVDAQGYPKPSVKLWEINDQNYKSYKDPNFRK